MRKLIGFALAVVVVSSSATLMAAIPQFLNYQGILRDTGGVPVGDGNHSVTFRFYDTESGGTPLWEETQTITTKAGLFSTLLGSLSPVPEIVFDNEVWLAISVGVDQEMSPRTRIASVGYAYHSLNSDKLQGLEPGELVYPSTPGRVFRLNSVRSAGSFEIFGPSGSTRQITGIFVMTTVGATATGSIDIAGAFAMQIVVSNTTPFSWTSGAGAPIEVGPADEIKVLNGGSGNMYVTITGFEY